MMVSSPQVRPWSDENTAPAFWSGGPSYPLGFHVSNGYIQRSGANWSIPPAPLQV